MAQETKGNSKRSTPKRGAFPTPRNVLADATPYKLEKPDEAGVTGGEPNSGSATQVQTGGMSMSDDAGAQRGASNVGTPGTPPPPSGSSGAGSKGGASNVGTPGTPPPPSGSSGAGSKGGAGNMGTPGTPPPPSGSSGAGSQGGTGNVGTPGTPPRPK